MVFNNEFGVPFRKYGINANSDSFGKAMDNGYPLGALAGKRKIMKKLEEVLVYEIFSREILSIVACLKTLKILERDNMIKNLSCLENNLKIKFNHI